jgi:hypothetical protein
MIVKNKSFKISQNQYNLTKSFKILKIFYVKIVFQNLNSIQNYQSNHNYNQSNPKYNYNLFSLIYKLSSINYMEPTISKKNHS